MNRSDRARSIVALAIFVVVVALSIAYRADATELVQSTTARIHLWGAVGAIAFIALYAAATIVLVPGSALTLAAGFAYGLPGIALVLPGAIIGSTISFVLARKGFRGAVAERVRKNPRLTSIDQAVADDGFRVVLLLRLSPVVPFALLNYGLGLTQLRTRDYVIASAIGIVPGALMYVYLGSLVTTMAELSTGGVSASNRFGLVLFGVGLLSTVLATFVVARSARRKLQSILANDSPIKPRPNG